MLDQQPRGGLVNTEKQSPSPPLRALPGDHSGFPDVLEGAHCGTVLVKTEPSPIARALGGVALVASTLGHGLRCAILVPEQEEFVLVAQAELNDVDQSLLGEFLQVASLSDLRIIGTTYGAEIRPLLTRAAEVVGLLIVFGFADIESESARKQLDEICSVATLAIEQEHLSDELTYRAHHDPLTHLWNRAWMEEQIKDVLDASEFANHSTGLILLGIDSFRLFNELLGREAGDQLLRLISARLTEILESGFLLARTASDEFTILMPSLHSEGRVAAFASQLRSRLEVPFRLGEHELIVRASFGTAIAKAGECPSSELQTRADQALMFAKRCARGRIIAYSVEMMKTPLERLVMERHLRFALQKREFELYYQPQIDLLSGRLLGVEALLRWKHPSLGFISPSTFVPIAEEIGIVSEIGDWVLAEAMDQLEVWHKAGLNKLRMAVNVSAPQFAHNDLAAIVAKRLRHSTVSPKYLELEITETTLMTDLEHGKRQLQLLRSLGVQTALDDFGTGHSSLAYLQNLPIDRLKIDRMFVKVIATPEERPALLSSIIRMGLNIGCKVLAEGVETVEQALALSRMDCQEAQGFLFSRPLSSAHLFEWAVSKNKVNLKAQAPGAQAPETQALSR